MFPVPTAARARAAIVAILTSSRSRSAGLVHQVSAVLAQWGLATIDPATFGLYAGAAGTAWASIAAGSTLLTATDNPWTAADVGKSVSIAGAGPAGAVLVTTIAAYVSAGQVQVAAAATTTVAADAASSGGIAVWGAVASLSLSSDPLLSADRSTELQAPGLDLTQLSAAVVTATGSPTQRSLAARAADLVSVLDYGADKTGTVDSVAAIQAAYAAIPAAGGVLYFPPGRYRINAPLAFAGNKPLTIIGAGKIASKILVNFASGDAITFVGDGYDDNFEMRTIGVEDITARNAGAWAVKVDGGVGNCILNDIDLNCLQRGAWIRNLSRALVRGVTATGMDTALHVENVGVGLITDNSLRTGNAGSGTSYGDGPCIMVRDSTSVKITANNFQGAGPRERVAIRGITSTGSDFTLVLDQATSPWKANGYIVIRGATPAAYNGVWRVHASTDQVPFATVTVSTAVNPGAASVAGVAEGISACLYVSADAGSCNESQVTGNLFEEMAFRGYGSASMFFDATRSDSRVQGWSIAGNYCDLGENGIIIQGKPTAAIESTCYGFNITGGEFESGTRLVLLDCVRGVTIAGINASAFGDTGLGSDNLLPAGIGSTAVHVIAGPAEPKTRGVTITNCNLGMNREWSYQQWLTYAMDAAITIDGAGIQDLSVVGCQLYGKGSATVRPVNGAQVAGSRWRFLGNRCIAGSGPGWTDAQEVPAIASAASVALPVGVDVVKITGSTTITSLTGGYVGRAVTLLLPSAITVLGVAFSANQTATAVYDGTTWFIK